VKRAIGCYNIILKIMMLYYSHLGGGAEWTIELGLYADTGISPE
jgi:hypothetical protein